MAPAKSDWLWLWLRQIMLVCGLTRFFCDRKYHPSVQPHTAAGERATACCARLHCVHTTCASGLRPGLGQWVDQLLAAPGQTLAQAATRGRARAVALCLAVVYDVGAADLLLNSYLSCCFYRFQRLVVPCLRFRTTTARARASWLLLWRSSRQVTLHND